MSKDEASEAKKKLLEINDLILKLDPAIRSQAFDFLAPQYFDGPAAKPKKKNDEEEASSDEVSDDDSGDEAAFFSKWDHSKPSDNVLLVVARLYNEHGVFPITPKIIKDLADHAGLTVPNRIDMTLNQAQAKGKSLFRKQGKAYMVTVSGEAVLKETYNVRKGKKPRPDDTDAQ